MYVVYLLNNLGSFIINLGSDIVRIANRIRGVYLLGVYLYAPIADTGFSIITVGSQIVGVGRGFEGVYNELRDNVNVSGVLQTLIYYTNSLVNFITNPIAYVASWVRNAFWYIDYIYTNTYDFIFNHVVRLLDTHLPWWRDIYGYVHARVGELFQDFNTLRYDPIRWIVDRLKAYSYNVGRFLNDPDGYLIERVGVLFPSMREFLNDPAGYIMNQLTDRLESFADRNMTRIIKIAENILSAIF